MLVHLDLIPQFAHEQSGIRYAGGRTGSIIAIGGAVAVILGYFNREAGWLAVFGGFCMIGLALISRAGTAVMVSITMIFMILALVQLYSGRLRGVVVGTGLIVGMVLVAAATGTIEMVDARFASVGSYDLDFEGTWGWRWVRWEFFWNQAMDDPGIFLFGIPMGKYFYFLGYNEINDTAGLHNAYLTILSKIGIFGLVGYLMMVAFTVSKLIGLELALFHHGLRGLWVSLINFSLIMFLVGWSVYIALNEELSWWNSGVLMWIFMGVSLKWVRIVNEDVLAVPAPAQDNSDLDRTVAI
ncbi:MAG: O-antigen ligase [Alphaproteobacteria bacterium]